MIDDTGGNGRGDRRTGVLLLLAAAILWSLNGVFIKSLHASGVGGLSIAAIRSLFACLFLTPFVLKRPKPAKDRLWIAATVVMFTAMCATFVIATTRTTAANAIILQYTAPAWVFLLSPLIAGERATSRQTLALVFSLAGVAVILLSQYQPGQRGLLIGLASGVVFGVQTVLFRRVRAVDPLVLVWYVCGGSAIVLLSAVLITSSLEWTPSALMWLAVMGVFQFGLPYVLFSMAVKKVTAQQAILLILLEPLLNPVWVWLSIGEVPHSGTIAGGALILIGVVYLSLHQSVKPKD